MGRLRLGTGPARVPARARGRPGGRHLRRRHRQRPRRGVRPQTATYLRTIGASAHVPGPLVAPRGLAVDPTGRLLVSDTDGNRIETFSQGGGATARASGRRPAGTPRAFDEPSGIGVDPRGSVYVADTGNARLVRALGRRHLPLRTRRPADSAAPGSRRPARSRCPRARRRCTWPTRNHNRVLVYAPTARCSAQWGAGEGDGAAGSGPGGSTTPRPRGRAAATCTWPTPATTASSSCPRRRVLAQSGALGARPTGISHTRPASPSTPPGGCTSWIAKTTASRCSTPSGRLPGQVGAAGDGLGDFSQPTAIAVGCDGDVYVADTNNNRVAALRPGRARRRRGCVAASAWPPPLDVAPVLRVSVPRAQRRARAARRSR